MKNILVTIAAVSALTAGCTSVPMASKADSDLVKQYHSPSAGNAGLYVYRSGSFGGALKKDVWLNGECVGETAPNMFFYQEVQGDSEHKLSTESEFSPNDLIVKAESGKNYFISQYIKMGVFVGGAGLELVTEEKGKKQVAKLDMAVKGKCSS
ncbi:Protein of unknown function [Colwellia chukchiensis]|uniref:DUF2846 domain-containing protein n=1 Tax=Colwellia chukchiensis TaxID=641665 RepID=A0A1H7SLL3_9GAMM|nr:DUF2846 domain-containing protein [Colwellia chukchiensis]SEL72624.1 Protein of unknown function [Colwellia chukchiensis]